MAKASKKSAKKTAAKSAMKASPKAPSIRNNKLTIDLSNVSLTDKEIGQILSTVQGGTIDKPKTTETRGIPQATFRGGPPKAGAEATTTGAVISATFFNTIPGRSELTATHNGVSKTITQSDTIAFDNVAVNDLIRIKGSSLGRAEIRIDRTANPQERQFEPGAFRFHFTVTA